MDNPVEMMTHSVMFADNVLKRLIAHTVNEEVDTPFDTCIETSGHIELQDQNNDKYILKLDIVDKDYMLDLKHFSNNPQVKEKMVFLLNAVKILYNPLKDHMKVWANEKNKSFNYVLQLSYNTTLFIDKDTEKRIGIILVKV